MFIFPPILYPVVVIFKVLLIPWHPNCMVEYVRSTSHQAWQEGTWIFAFLKIFSLKICFLMKGPFLLDSSFTEHLSRLFFLVFFWKYLWYLLLHQKKKKKKNPRDVKEQQTHLILTHLSYMLSCAIICKLRWNNHLFFKMENIGQTMFI